MQAGKVEVNLNGKKVYCQPTPVLYKRRITMFGPNRNELSGWMKLFTRKVLIFLFVIAWLAMAWALDECVRRWFPLHGVPMLVARCFVVVLDIYTLYELLDFLHKLHKEDGADRNYPPWWI